MRKMKQSGFTMVELLVAVVVLGVLLSIIYPMFGDYLLASKKAENKRRLLELQVQMTAFAEQNAWDFFSQYPQTTTGVLTTPGTCNPPAAGSVTNNISGFPAVPAGSPSICLFGRSAGAPAARNAILANGMYTAPGAFNFLGSSASIVSGLDAFSNPFRVYVSNPICPTIDGMRVCYRNVAFASLGNRITEDGAASHAAFDASLSFDVNTGVMTVLNNDADYILFNGFEIARKKAQENKKRIGDLKEAWQTYFSSQFLGSAIRDITVSYFGCLTSGLTPTQREQYVFGSSGCAPADRAIRHPYITGLNALTPGYSLYNALPATTGVGVDCGVATSNCFLRPLGLDDSSGYDTYGNPIKFLFASDSTLFGNSPEKSNNRAPYSATLFSPLPLDVASGAINNSQSLLIESIVGMY